MALKSTSTSRVVVLRKTKPSLYMENGLITVQVEYPLYVHVENLTHRWFARNASSARAMSTERYVDMGYYIPDRFYQSSKGMQAGADTIKYQWLARLIWHSAYASAVFHTRLLERLGVAKEQRNRLIPPIKMVRAIVTGTEGAWNHFFSLRDTPEADKAMQQYARECKTKIMQAPWVFSTTHMPYSDMDEQTVIANVARVSYNRTSGKDDKALYESLLSSRHMSPFEHVAYWTYNPRKSCYTTKPEDLDHGSGWESLRSRIE